MHWTNQQGLPLPCLAFAVLKGKASRQSQFADGIHRVPAISPWGVPVFSIPSGIAQQDNGKDKLYEKNFAVLMDKSQKF